MEILIIQLRQIDKNTIRPDNLGILERMLDI